MSNSRGGHGVLRWALSLGLALLSGKAEAQSDLGHKLLGTLGLRAGSQLPTGLYLADRLVEYTSDALINRSGERIPVEDFDLTGLSNVIGLAFVYQLPGVPVFYNAAVGLPVAHVSVRTDRAEAAIDRYGLADAYIQPFKLGLRLPQLDLVAGYAFYIPTRHFSPGEGSGVSRAHWSHELSLGGTVYADAARTWHLSALASLELNQPKQGVDITRGSTVQIQGGAGKSWFGVLDLGLVGYALWQVTDDTGPDLPAVLAGARDQAYGLGAELGITIPAARFQLVVRYTRDLEVQSRPEGQLLMFSLSFAPWLPSAP